MSDTATQLGPVTFERVIDATPDEAFALFTEPERLRRWQAVSASIDLRVGGDYRLTVTPGHIACGTFTEIEPGKRVVYTWGWEGSDDLGPGASTVVVDLEPSGDKTLVRLTHLGLTAEQAVGHSEGWTHFLDRLGDAASRGRRRPRPMGYRRRRTRPPVGGRGELGAVPAGDASVHAGTPRVANAV